MKDTSEDVNSVIRAVLTDDLLENDNCIGRWGNQELAKLKLFQKILRGMSIILYTNYKKDIIYVSAYPYGEATLNLSFFNAFHQILTSKQCILIS